MARTGQGPARVLMVLTLLALAAVLVTPTSAAHDPPSKDDVDEAIGQVWRTALETARNHTEDQREAVHDTFVEHVGQQTRCERPYAPGPLGYRPLTPFAVCVYTDQYGCTVLLETFFLACLDPRHI